MINKENGATQIRILMLQAGITQAQIARDLEITRSLVNQVVASTRKNPKVRQAIAKAVGADVEDLWPDKEQGKGASA